MSDDEFDPFGEEESPEYVGEIQVTGKQRTGAANVINLRTEIADKRLQRIAQRVEYGNPERDRLLVREQIAEILKEKSLQNLTSTCERLESLDNFLEFRNPRAFVAACYVFSRKGKGTTDLGKVAEEFSTETVTVSPYDLIRYLRMFETFSMNKKP